MTRSRLALAAVLLLALVQVPQFEVTAGRAAVGGRRSVLPRPAALAIDRARREAARRRGGRRPGQQVHLLPGHHRRRRVEDRRRRAQLGQRLRRLLQGAARSAPSPSRRPNPNVIYVGMGEALHPRQRRPTATASTSRPTPARPGRTSGLEDTRQIGTAAVSIRPIPTSSTSRRWATPGARTPTAASTARTDGGKTWEKVLYRERERRRASTSCIDPANPERALRRRAGAAPLSVGLPQRRPGQRRSTSRPTAATPGPRSRAKPGLPKGDKGTHRRRRSRRRSPTACGRSSTRPAPTSGIYRSDDGGETWTHLTDNADLTQRPWYYHHIFADPQERRRGLGAQRRAAGSPPTAARPSARWRCRTATTTTCGSTRRTRSA